MPRGNWIGPKPSSTAASCPPKRGSGVGRTKVGKGTKVIAVVEGNGLPIGLYVASAQPYELTLAQATPETIRVSRPRAHPRTRPGGWWPIGL